MKLGTEVCQYVAEFSDKDITQSSDLAKLQNLDEVLII